MEEKFFLGIIERQKDRVEEKKGGEKEKKYSISFSFIKCIDKIYRKIVIKEIS